MYVLERPRVGMRHRGEPKWKFVLTFPSVQMVTPENRSVSLMQDA